MSVTSSKRVGISATFRGAVLCPDRFGHGDLARNHLKLARNHLKLDGMGRD